MKKLVSLIHSNLTWRLFLNTPGFLANFSISNLPSAFKDPLIDRFRTLFSQPHTVERIFAYQEERKKGNTPTAPGFFTEAQTRADIATLLTFFPEVSDLIQITDATQPAPDTLTIDGTPYTVAKVLGEGINGAVVSLHPPDGKNVAFKTVALSVGSLDEKTVTALHKFDQAAYDEAKAAYEQHAADLKTLEDKSSASSEQVQDLQRELITQNTFANVYSQIQERLADLSSGTAASSVAESSAPLLVPDESSEACKHLLQLQSASEVDIPSLITSADPEDLYCNVYMAMANHRLTTNFHQTIPHRGNLKFESWKERALHELSMLAEKLISSKPPKESYETFLGVLKHILPEEPDTLQLFTLLFSELEVCKDKQKPLDRLAVIFAGFKAVNGPFKFMAMSIDFEGILDRPLPEVTPLLPCQTLSSKLEEAKRQAARDTRSLSAARKKPSPPCPTSKKDLTAKLASDLYTHFCQQLFEILREWVFLRHIANTSGVAPSPGQLTVFEGINFTKTPYPGVILGFTMAQSHNTLKSAYVPAPPKTATSEALQRHVLDHHPVIKERRRDIQERKYNVCIHESDFVRVNDEYEALKAVDATRKTLKELESRLRQADPTEKPAIQADILALRKSIDITPFQDSFYTEEQLDRECADIFIHHQRTLLEKMGALNGTEEEFLSRLEEARGASYLQHLLPIHRDNPLLLVKLYIVLEEDEAFNDLIGPDVQAAIHRLAQENAQQATLDDFISKLTAGIKSADEEKRADYLALVEQECDDLKALLLQDMPVMLQKDPSILVDYIDTVKLQLTMDLIHAFFALLHRSKITHSDLKSANVLLSLFPTGSGFPTSDVKVADFSLSSTHKFIPSATGTATTTDPQVTLSMLLLKGYMKSVTRRVFEIDEETQQFCEAAMRQHPVNGTSSTTLADLWSLAVVICDLCTGGGLQFEQLNALFESENGVVSKFELECDGIKANYNPSRQFLEQNVYFLFWSLLTYSAHKLSNPEFYAPMFTNHRVFPPEMDTFLSQLLSGTQTSRNQSCQDIFSHPFLQKGQEVLAAQKEKISRYPEDVKRYLQAYMVAPVQGIPFAEAYAI